MSRTVIKTTGHLQPFSAAKLRRSIVRAGGSRAMAHDVAEAVETGNTFQTTQDLHDHTYRRLLERSRPVAARYDLKRALFRLGPTGYPFELYIAEIFRGLGYRTAANQVLPGTCISHEVDVVAEDAERKVFIECKYHNAVHLRSDVKTALYIKARFDDLRGTLEKDADGRKIQGLIVTNTDFTKDAVDYVRCAGAHIGLIGWRRPRGFSLAELIDRTGLHPVTALTTLSDKQKDRMINDGVVLCRDLPMHPGVLAEVGVTGHKADRVMREARAVCELKDVIE